jgi:hypothetical protein
MRKNKEQFAKAISSSKEYPDALYQSTERLGKRLKKERRRKRILFTTLPSFTAAMLFVILVNNNIAFARSLKDIPILNKLTEYVMYNASLKSAVENDHIQYVNLKDTDEDLTLSLPYVISDERNLILFFDVPSDFLKNDHEDVMISREKIIDRDTGKVIDKGYISYSSSLGYLGESEETSHLSQLNIDFVEVVMPRNLTLEVTLTKSSHEGSISKKLAEYRFSYDLTLEPPQGPKVYELNQSVWIEDQEILLEKLIQYPTMSLFTYSIKNSNTMDITMSMDFYNDGVLTPLNTTGYLTQHEDSPDGKTIITMRIQDNYFKVPKERLLKIHSYTMVPKDRKPLKVNLEEKTLEDNPYGILLKDITTEDNVTTITFHTSENYHSLPFRSTRDGNKKIQQALYTSYTEDLNIKTYSYSFRDVIGDALYFDVADGPLKTLREPILVPIPMDENR